MDASGYVYSYDVGCYSRRHATCSVAVAVSKSMTPPVRYRLRTLLILLAVMPPVLATAYWIIEWLLGNRLHPTLFAILVIAYAVSSIAGPILLYRELIYMMLGPEAYSPMPRKVRRRVRFRLERYAGEST
jgi:hypothetical protein